MKKYDKGEGVDFSGSKSDVLFEWPLRPFYPKHR